MINAAMIETPAKEARRHGYVLGYLPWAIHSRVVYKRWADDYATMGLIAEFRAGYWHGVAVFFGVDLD